MTREKKVGDETRRQVQVSGHSLDSRALWVSFCHLMNVLHLTEFGGASSTATRVRGAVPPEQEYHCGHDRRQETAAGGQP